jgi:hypothetical protein
MARTRYSGIPAGSPCKTGHFRPKRPAGTCKQTRQAVIASRIAHPKADVERCITEMVRIDRQEEGEVRAAKVAHLSHRYGRIRQEIARLREMDKALGDAPDGQISLTDPDARAMSTSARHSGLVGCNAQRR